MATVTLHEALVIQSKIKDPVRIILLLDYTIGSDVILAHSTTEFTPIKRKTVGTEKNDRHFTPCYVDSKSESIQRRHHH